MPDTAVSVDDTRVIVTTSGRTRAVVVNGMYRESGIERGG